MFLKESIVLSFEDFLRKTNHFLAQRDYFFRYFKKNFHGFLNLYVCLSCYVRVVMLCNLALRFWVML